MPTKNLWSLWVFFLPQTRPVPYAIYLSYRLFALKVKWFLAAIIVQLYGKGKR